ncbi:MAG TPA: S24/S26 family peptidase [Nitrospiraceae bacterium]|nr:S24/S26 family peptidase [Nitrospiraceae bacterium]
MIHLLPPLTLDGRFSTQDLPNELQLVLLSDMIVPRIVSSSMMPTIQEGDRLELSPPTSLTVGEIVVFRNDTLLVCHRITTIHPQGTLSTRGDATQGACESVQPGSVIGVVTGVLREGTHISLGNSPRMSSAAAQPSNLKNRVRTVVARSVTRSIRVLSKLPLFQPMLALLLRWTATVDVHTPTPLQSLPSHCKVASFTLRIFPHVTRRLAASIERKPTHYVVRLGPWRLAQYDPTTESLLLRQSLRDAGLEPLFRQILCDPQTA